MENEGETSIGFRELKFAKKRGRPELRRIFVDAEENFTILWVESTSTRVGASLNRASQDRSVIIL